MRRLRKAVTLSQASAQPVVFTGRPSLFLAMGETTDQELVPFRLESFYGTGWESDSSEKIAFISVPKLSFGIHRGLVDVSVPQNHTVIGVPGDPNNWLGLYGFAFRPGMTVNEFGQAYEKIWKKTEWLPIPESQSPLRFAGNSVLARIGSGSWFPLEHHAGSAVVTMRYERGYRQKPMGVWGPELVAAEGGL
jgi:hypothetical protein